MRNRIDITEPDIINNQKISTYNNQNAISLADKNINLEILAAEGCENFVNYIEWLGLARDPNLLVLSSMHHYYYDAADLKDIKTVVNILPLNQIKQIKSFFHSIYHLIPQKCNFIGCFMDNKKHNRFVFKKTLTDKQSEAFENDILSRIPFLNMIYSIIDSRSNKYFSRRNVVLLLEDYGFKVKDITELNGLTYFCAQKFHAAEEKS
jgi:hypothetical protein